MNLGTAARDRCRPQHNFDPKTPALAWFVDMTLSRILRPETTPEFAGTFGKSSLLPSPWRTPVRAAAPVAGASTARCSFCRFAERVRASRLLNFLPASRTCSTTPVPTSLEAGRETDPDLPPRGTLRSRWKALPRMLGGRRPLHWGSEMCASSTNHKVKAAVPTQQGICPTGIGQSYQERAGFGFLCSLPSGHPPRDRESLAPGTTLSLPACSRHVA